MRNRSSLLLVPRAFVAVIAGSLILGCTPKQGEPVPYAQLFTDAKLHGKYATVVGVLNISGGFMGSTTCKQGRCDLELGSPEPGFRPPGEGLSYIKIGVSAGSSENEMAELPSKYSRADLKVKAMGGKVLVAGDKVKVSGDLRCHGNNNEDQLPCSMSVDRVDVP